MSIIDRAVGALGHTVSSVGRTYDYLTPGAGTSSLTNVGRTLYSGGANAGGGAAQGTGADTAGLATTPGRGIDVGGQADASGIYDPYTASYGGSGGTSAADAVNYQTRLQDLNDLLGRTQTGLDQGLSTLNNSYQSNVNQQQSQENQALQDYTDKRTQTNKDKLGAYDTINQNANNGYRSLAQIIGRSAGTGSSAFQDLLPNVVGKDTSAKRGDANSTYAANLGNIDTAQKKTELSFQNILADLANQRAQQEQTLRSGVEGQRQNILGQQQQLQAAQGNPAAVNDLQGQIQNSRSAVDNFFNQYQPTITAQQAAIAAPDLTQYSTDRSTVNAAAAGSPDPTNPYADILRKKLQDSAV